MKQKLWNRNFTLLMAATTLGAAGGIAGSFALSFLVFDETGSTLAAALTVAVKMAPGFVIPLVAAPWMDRLPRKPFLVGGDLLGGLLYLLAGLYLRSRPFTYLGYLGFSLLLAALSAFDELAYTSIFPKLIPAGQEEKGYTAAAMLYPVLNVLMMPVAALLLESIGAANILLLQGGLALLAAAVESRIRLREESRMEGRRFSFRLWREDVLEAARYLKQERGLRAIYNYMAVTNGMAYGYSGLMVAFFRTAPGFTTAMYSFFSVAEFAGRTLGGALHYNLDIPKEKRFSFAFGVYQIYEALDTCLLWLPYPLMLANRAACGFLGMNSAAMRQASVQRYLPDRLRARVNAYESMLILAAGSTLSLAVGALGELLDYRVCMTVCGLASMAACWGTVWKNRRAVRRVYEAEQAGQTG